MLDSRPKPIEEPATYSSSSAGCCVEGCDTVGVHCVIAMKDNPPTFGVKVKEYRYYCPQHWHERNV